MAEASTKTKQIRRLKRLVNQQQRIIKMLTNSVLEAQREATAAKFKLERVDEDAENQNHDANV